MPALPSFSCQELKYQIEKLILLHFMFSTSIVFYIWISSPPFSVSSCPYLCPILIFFIQCSTPSFFDVLSCQRWWKAFFFVAISFPFFNNFLRFPIFTFFWFCCCCLCHLHLHHQQSVYLNKMVGTDIFTQMNTCSVMTRVFLAVQNRFMEEMSS